MSTNDIDCLYYEIISELNKLKSKRLNQIHMQDYNVDVIKKNNTKSPNNESEKDFSLNVANGLNFVYKQKTVLSKRQLRRRAKKIFKLQSRIEKGYISAIDDSIKIIEKIYKNTLEE